MRKLSYKNSLFLITILLFMSTVGYSYPTGVIFRTGSPSDGSDCNACHFPTVDANTPRIAPEVTLEGPRKVVVNKTYSYKLIQKGVQPGPFKKLGGMNLGVDKGTLIKTDFRTTLKTTDSTNPNAQKQLMQRGGAPVDSNDLITWTFDWTAPDTIGTVMLYASALAANGDGTSDGDRSTSIAEAIEVVVAPPTPVPPVAYIKAPKSAPIGDAVVFDSSASFDGDGSIVSYDWKVAGTAAETTSTINHTFSNAGVKTIELIVTDDDGKTDKAFVDITIVDVANGGSLVPEVKISMPQTGKTGVEISFDASGTVATGADIKYIWDFGDGSNLELSQAQTSSMTHVYSSTGNYTVTVAAQDGILTGITSTEITISDSVVITPPVKTGVNLYKQHCESCHGAAGVGITGVAKNIKGATNQFILDAIDSTSTTAVTAMSAITLELGDAQLVADYLASGAGTTADSIYINKCELCHGTNGQGAVYKKIRNATAQMITNAIGQTSTPVIPFMKGITLSASDSTLLAAFLKDGTATVETGKSLYDSLCAICHGSSGTGGSAKLIVNTTLTLVDNAIATQQAMSVIPEITALTPAQRQKIVDYLKSNIVIPGDPNAGELVFKAKCQMCHGTGTGGMAIGILNASVIMIENAITNIPLMQTIVLNQKDKQNLVALLARGAIIKPGTGAGIFSMYCSYCHGADGLGGAFKNASIKGMGITAQLIIDAYTGGEPEMSASNLRNAGLTLTDRQALANWLK